MKSFLVNSVVALNKTAVWRENVDSTTCGAENGKNVHEEQTKLTANAYDEVNKV